MTLLPSLLALLVLQSTSFQHERVFGPEIPSRYKHPAALTELANGDLLAK